jgi:hypothetical protein
VFNGDITALKIILYEIYPVVNHIIIAESRSTYKSGEEKKIIQLYNDKIIYLVSPSQQESDLYESFSLGIQTLNLQNSDHITISRASEIPSQSFFSEMKLRQYQLETNIFFMEMKELSENSDTKHYGGKIFSFETFSKASSIIQLVNYPCENAIINSGWHIKDNYGRTSEEVTKILALESCPMYFKHGLDVVEYFYLGEFGYFCDIIIGSIQQYVVRNPDRKQKICIHTYKEYAFIINHLFPDYFKFVHISLDQDRNFHNCSAENNEKLKSISNIKLLFEKPVPEFLEDMLENPDIRFYIRDPIKFDFPTDYYSKYKNINVFFFRKRIIDPRRNYDYDKNSTIYQMCNEYSEKLMSDKDSLSVIYTGNETLVPDFVSQAENILFIPTLEKLSPFLCAATRFCSSDSGLISYAKLCGCKDILIFPNPVGNTIWQGQFTFNPFPVFVRTL